MSTELATAPVTPGFHKATTQLSATLGIEPRMMVDTLKKQCFPSMRAEDVSDAQLAAFISVANTMELNPLIPGHLYAYPGKNGGIVPVCGPDGVLKKLDERITDGKLDGYECAVYPEDVTLPPTHAIAKIFRTGKDAHPSMFTAIYKEWVVSSNGNWASRPRHMLWLRAIKQCARQVIHGVPFDEDDVKIGDMVNVTPDAAPTIPDRPPPPPRQKKGVSTVADSKPADKAIEAEIVPPSAPVLEQTPPKPEPTPAPAPVAAPVQAARPANPKLPRASLNPDEKATFVCKVEKVFCLFVTAAGVKHASVQANVLGDFVGQVTHLGGAQDNKGAIGEPVSAAWKDGATVTLNLEGKTFKPGGKVFPCVVSIEAPPASPEASMDE